MQMEFQQSEQVAARRRWILVLVDSADGVTGKTGQTGTVQISNNGGAPAASTNNIVEVDSVNMPGHYYIELTAGELQQLGMISIYYKAAGTLAFHDRGFVSYDDPFARHGGFAQGGGGTSSKGGGLTRAQAQDLIDRIRKVVAEEMAQVEAAEDPKESETLQRILAAVEKEQTVPDLGPVLEAIGGIEKPTDYGPLIDKAVFEMQQLTKPLAKIVPTLSTFTDSVNSMEGKLKLTSKDIDESLKALNVIIPKFDEFQKAMEVFQSTLKDQSDMDKRFDGMMQASNNKKITELASQMRKMAEVMVNLKYELMKELIKK